jgi:outer membrane immunogenic protein
MKKILGMAFVALLTAPAMAADIPVKAGPPVIEPPSWSACYIGVNGGFGWGNTKLYRGAAAPIGLLEAEHDSDGGVAGGQIGCDLQYQSWVFGIEIRGNWSGIESDNVLATAPPQTANFSTQLRNFGMLTFRTGYAFGPNFMAFFRSGLAIGRVRHEETAAVAIGGVPVGTVIANTSYTAGWLTAGGGLEYLWGRNWSVFAEFAYFRRGWDSQDFRVTAAGAPAFGAPAGTPIALRERTQFGLVMAGINYRFGSWPVVARY